MACHLGSLVAVAMLFLANKPAWSESYIPIGPDETGSINSLDFDSIKPSGPSVQFTYRSMYKHDPKWNVPANNHSYVGTMIDNCDNEIVADASWKILDLNDVVVGHGNTNRDRLQFSHDPDSETLLPKIACARVKLVTDAASAANAARPIDSDEARLQPQSKTNSVPGGNKSASITHGRGYTEFHDKGISAQVDNTGKGAVLCLWQIYSFIIEVGNQCFKNNDDIQRELVESVKRIDAFIIRNSSHPVTQAQLSASEAQATQNLHKSGNMCKGDGANLYQRVRSGGAAGIHGSLDELLSVPREPVMNPCL